MINMYLQHIQKKDLVHSNITARAQGTLVLVQSFVDDIN